MNHELCLEYGVAWGQGFGGIVRSAWECTTAPLGEWPDLVPLISVKWNDRSNVDKVLCNARGFKLIDFLGSQLK